MSWNFLLRQSCLLSFQTRPSRMLDFSFLFRFQPIGAGLLRVVFPPCYFNPHAWLRHFASSSPLIISLSLRVCLMCFGCSWFFGLYTWFLLWLLRFFSSYSWSFLKRASSTRILHKLSDGGSVFSVPEHVDNWVWDAWKKRAKGGKDAQPMVNGITAAQNGIDDCWNVTDEICYYCHGQSFSNLDILLEPSLGLKRR